MQISKCMKKNIVTIPDSATISDAANVFVKQHIGLLPVLDKNGKPVGVVGIQDMLKLELPDFVNIVEDVDFVHDFGAVETTRPPAATLAKSITKLMKPPLSVPAECGLLRAYALLVQHNMHDLLVVAEDGKLIGITSRVDLGRAILSSWAKVERK